MASLDHRFDPPWGLRSVGLLTDKKMPLNSNAYSGGRVQRHCCMTRRWAALENTKDMPTVTADSQKPCSPQGAAI
jgi:hypothetical protein